MMFSAFVGPAAQWEFFIYGKRQPPRSTSLQRELIQQILSAVLPIEQPAPPQRISLRTALLHPGACTHQKMPRWRSPTGHSAFLFYWAWLRQSFMAVNTASLVMVARKQHPRRWWNHLGQGICQVSRQQRRPAPGSRRKHQWPPRSTLPPETVTVTFTSLSSP